MMAHRVVRKKMDPQKNFIKNICRVIKGFGLAECWYEETEPILSKVSSFIWTWISMTYLVSVVVSEVLANFRKDLTVAERNDAILFSLAHPVILFKIVILYIQRDNIKVLLETMLEDEGAIDTDDQIVVETVIKFKRHCFILCFSMFMAISTGTINAIRIYFIDGIPVRTLVPYWPTSADHGVFVNIVRFMVNFHWWYIVTVMLGMDTLSLTSLIFLESKFRQLQHHFLNLRRKFLENVEVEKREDLKRAMTEGFVKGVKFHAKILWCAKKLQSALGSIYSAQVIQSISLLAMCLVKQVSMEYTLTTIMANMAFIACMLVLTGCYMTAAGDITYQAGLVSYAMFSCGWEQCRGLRFLLVMGIQRAHKPVAMTAFGIFDLSYRNFISVLRTSYSFFAIMY